MSGEEQSPLLESRAQLIEAMASGAKPKEQWRVGTEHEKHVFRKDPIRPVPYGGEDGIHALLEGIAARAGQRRVAGGVGQAHVDAGRAADAMPGDAEALQHLDHAVLEPVDVFLDEDVQPLQVDQRVGHHLPRAVVGDLPAAVGLNHRDALRVQHVVGLSRHALGVDRVVLAQPDLVGRVRITPGGELAHRLDAAVASRLVADVPFGAFLSGGLDSSVVVALMARHLGQPVRTFSIGFREDAYNELSDARRVARHLNTEHHELVVEPDAVELLQQLVWYLDEPFADSSAIPTFLVSRLARERVTMVLTGDGGDEAFAGYDRYLRYLALQRLGGARPLAAAFAKLGGHLLPGARGYRLRRIGERLGQEFPASYLSGVALTREDIAQDLLGDALHGDYYGSASMRTDGGGDALDRIVAIDIDGYLPDDILVKLDRMAMANSLEGRAPLLDHRLVEFAASLPADLRIRNGRGKYLLRQVARRWLPADVLDKPKQGFAIPLAAWFRGPLRALAADVIASRAFRERGLMRAAAAERYLAAHVAGEADFGETLWLILSLELWARRFLDAAPARS